MPISIRADGSDSDARLAGGQRASWANSAAHHAASFLWPFVVIFAAATVALMATFWPLAVVTGFIAIFAGTGLVIARGLEGDRRHEPAVRVTAPASRREPSAPERRAIANVEGADVVALAEARADSGEIADDAAPLLPGGEIDGRIVARESKAVAGLAIGLAMLALLLGFVLFEWPMIGLGVAIVMLYGAIVTFPAWAAWIEGDVEESSAKAGR
ncbi:MAG TPA: hypothetical protein PKC43_00005 [Phycisphaerales bacterium]|nr:hypothetical protein [Phycisphaerales bacterium]HMP35806.1 hypothetical protein [Phycisphaerales bacterium]